MSTCLSDMSIKRFDEDGYAICDLFDQDQLSSFAESFGSLLEMQCRKLAVKTSGDLAVDANSLNSANRTALDEVLLMARHTRAGQALAGTNGLIDLSATLLRSTPDRLIVSGPSFFVNVPRSSERKYTWHSEQNWYPKRRKFLNVWCPILEDRTRANSMAIMRGSHLKDWFYFSEYTGYEGSLDAHANVQYEIPANFLSEYIQEIPTVKLGQGLVFDGRLVHRSLDNLGEIPIFTIVFRVFDYSDDLTLSANWADVPYNRKSLGWPDIQVNRTVGTSSTN